MTILFFCHARHRQRNSSKHPTKDHFGIFLKTLSLQFHISGTIHKFFFHSSFLNFDRTGDHGNRRVQDNRPTQAGLTLGAGAVHRPSPPNGRSLVAETKRLSGGSPRNRSWMKHFQPVSFHYVTLLQRNEGFPAVGT
ncbi:hypothetical protein [Burkholderia ubonensis]|uniref:hypothetical protein n=1 Tax=Burkholderia ubonensis TaxID=101571 RepID=UPI0012F768BA|nr:hypothetical protein [Burkholderia ubonensis]